MPIPRVLNLAVKDIDSEKIIKGSLSMAACQDENFENAKRLMQGVYLF